MTLNPFVYGSAAKPSCFDESSPCTLEQTSMCVISVTSKNDTSKFPGQAKYVPWLVCMDSSGDKLPECHEKAGVDPSAVAACMKSDVGDLLEKYIKLDKPIQSTPTVAINGKHLENSQTSYRGIHTAICKADPSLKGCSSNAIMPSWADDVPTRNQRPHASHVDTIPLPVVV